jgi:hypothetical protein
MNDAIDHRPDRSYPTDAIGNPIRKGDIVRVALTEAALIFRVVEVNPAGSIVAPGGDGTPMSMLGTVILTAMVPVKFAAGAAMGNILVLRTPDGMEQAVAGSGSRLEIVKPQ